VEVVCGETAMTMREEWSEEEMGSEKTGEVGCGDGDSE
jgi:hypothetical protein